MNGPISVKLFAFFFQNRFLLINATINSEDGAIDPFGPNFERTITVFFSFSPAQFLSDT